MSEPVVDEDDVRHVAELARIDLDEDELERFCGEFVDILGYFDRLDDVPDLAPEDDRVNVLRPDDVQESLDQDEALANAEETDDGFFKGPPVG